MRVSDLLTFHTADDKHYLLGTHVSLGEGNVLKMYFQSEDSTIHLDEIADFQVKPVRKYENTKDLLEKNTWLLSMGTILLFGESVENAKIPLLERDILASSDPLRLTSSAGRLDTTLSQGCMAELFEEMIFASQSAYYQLDQGVDLYGNMQQEQIEKLQHEKKSVEVLSSTPLQLKNSYTVEMFLDGECIDSVENVFLVIDEKNKTLEFRQVILTPLPKDLEYIIDGDGFGRNIYMFSLKDLKDLVKTFSIKNVEETMFYSGKNLMPECDAFLSSMNGKKWKKKLRLPLPLFTKTLTEFLSSL